LIFEVSFRKKIEVVNRRKRNNGQRCDLKKIDFKRFFPSFF